MRNHLWMDCSTFENNGTWIRIDQQGARVGKISEQNGVDMNAASLNALIRPQWEKRGLRLARRTTNTRLIQSCQPWLAAAVLLAAVSLRGATVSWVGGSGDWSTAANWSKGALPGPIDDVVISPTNTAITVTHSSGSDTINSLMSQVAFQLPWRRFMVPMRGQKPWRIA